LISTKKLVGFKAGGITIMITGISHAQITVLTDSEANDRKFYCGFFGLKEVEKPENRRRNGV